MQSKSCASQIKLTLSKPLNQLPSVLVDAGQFVIADKDQLHVMRLSASGDDAALDLTQTLVADGFILSVSAGPAGLFIVQQGRDGRLSLAKRAGQGLRKIADLAARPEAVLVQHRRVLALMPPVNGRPGELIAVNPKTGMVEDARPMPVGATRLRASANGDTSALVVVPRRHRLYHIDLNDACVGAPRRTPPDPVRDPGRGASAGGCCDCRCGHCDRCTGTDPVRGPRRPVRPGSDPCDPGSDGVDDGCIRYTAIGTTVVKRDRCHSDRPDCRRDMHSKIERLERIGAALIVITRKGRMITELDPHTLAVRSEAGLRPAATLLAAPPAPVMLEVSNDLRDVRLFQFNPSAGIAGLELQADISERVYLGSPTLGTEPGPLFALEEPSILIIPIVHPGQNFNGTAQAYHDALFSDNPEGPIPKVLRYYGENSDDQQMMNFEVFGVDSTDFYEGPPIQIDAPIASYYRGSFVPGGFVTVNDMGASPVEVRFRGDSSIDVTAFSSVNPGASGQDNPNPFTLDFPAAVVTVRLGGGTTFDIDTGNPNWVIGYRASDGSARNLMLDPSTLPSDVQVAFNNNGLASSFSGEVEDIRAAVQTMMNATGVADDFAPIEVIWGNFDNDDDIGQLHILFRFADGPGDVPQFLDEDAAGMGSALGIASDAIEMVRGWANFITTMADSVFANEVAQLRYFLIRALRLAQVTASPDGLVDDPIIVDVQLTAVWNGPNLTLVTRFIMSNVHGQDGVGVIELTDTTGPDPLNFAGGVPEQGSPFSADDNNTMIDKAGFYEMLYGHMVNAVDGHLGNPNMMDWEDFRDYLDGFKTVYTFPVDAARPGSGDWSVDEPGSGPGMRAFVGGLKEPTTDPNGMAVPVEARWGMNFMSFDPVIADDATKSPLESDTRTLAHELGHTLGLGDQYGSTKFDPTIEYVGGLDLMGGSQANWPHFCAYHKLALGWLGETDRLEIDPPAQGDTITTRCILVPTEWWTGNEGTDARAAFPNAPADVPVGVAAICDLGGTGGVIATIEARAPGEAFSQGMAPDGDVGRVLVLNVLDYGASGRYGQVIADENTVPADALKNMFRYRRRIHQLDGNMQVGDAFDMGAAPGFPFEGITVHVDAQETINIDGNVVPVYDIRVVWTGGQAADVGFADNAEEWRSADIGIDYIGNDPENDQSGVSIWPDGSPQNQGNQLVIPQSGTEPHQVVVRVHNFGAQTAHNVEFELYMRDPGGGGELHGDEPYYSEVISEIPAASQGGLHEIRVDWDVPAGQDPHVCWRAEVSRFEIGEGTSAQVIVTDASVTNNWAQQNIFETYSPYASPPEPVISRFSVTNDGPFTEIAHLVPVGLPHGARLRVRPRTLRVPPYATRTFGLQFDFDEEMTRDPCLRDMDVLLRCMRHDDHTEELWGASMFRIHLRRRTDLEVTGTWYGNTITLTGAIDPAISIGRVSLRLDFQNGDPAQWIGAPLNPGGMFQQTFDAAGFEGTSEVLVTAQYRGTDVFAPTVSPQARIEQVIVPG